MLFLPQLSTEGDERLDVVMFAVDRRDDVEDIFHVRVLHCALAEMAVCQLAELGFQILVSNHVDVQPESP